MEAEWSLVHRSSTVIMQTLRIKSKPSWTGQIMVKQTKCLRRITTRPVNGNGLCQWSETMKLSATLNAMKYHGSKTRQMNQWDSTGCAESINKKSTVESDQTGSTVFFIAWLSASLFCSFLISSISRSQNIRNSIVSGMAEVLSLMMPASGRTTV